MEVVVVGLVDPEAQETTTTGATSRLDLLCPRVHVPEALEHARCGDN